MLIIDGQARLSLLLMACLISAKMPSASLWPRAIAEMALHSERSRQSWRATGLQKEKAVERSVRRRPKKNQRRYLELPARKQGLSLLHDQRSDRSTRSSVRQTTKTWRWRDYRFAQKEICRVP